MVEPSIPIEPDVIDSPKFKLSRAFLDRYKTIKPPFGFNGLGELVYYRSYSRLLEDGTNEVWWQTVQRVVEGCYNIQKRWIEQHNLGWNAWKAQYSSQNMYDRIFNMKFLPPGRGLWMMGTPYVEERGITMGLFNCSARTTANIDTEFAEPFCFAQDLSMLGVGVGFDTWGAGTLVINRPVGTPVTYVVLDSREGWVDSTRVLLNSYFKKKQSPVEFDYSCIRAAGVPIKGFGGISGGYEPLEKMHNLMRECLDKYIDKPITPRVIVDLMNFIGIMVVSGNVRRTALLALGSMFDLDYLDLKDYSKNPDRMEHGWSSNNSVAAEIGADYTDVSKRIAINGEPGLIWLENARAYGRMADPPDSSDSRVTGCNPCQPSFAPLLTPEGLVKFRDIRVGSRIWSKDGWTTVIRKERTGVKPVYKYATATGYFIGTENHRVVSNKKKVEVSEALTIDSLLGSGNTEIVVDPQDVMDGLVIGQGYKEDSGEHRIFLYDTEYTLYGLNPELEKLTLEPRQDGDSHYVNTTITPDELVSPATRSIPERFIRSRNKTVGFLLGFYGAKGVCKNNKIVMSTSSPAMRDQLLLMLNSIGIPAYLMADRYVTGIRATVEHTCKESYTLSITQGVNEFLRIMGFELKGSESYKPKTLGYTRNAYEIVSRVYLGKHTVYSITVDNDSHTYWTGGLDVANCGEIMLEGGGEMCNVVETFPDAHEDFEDFKQTLKYAYLYGKTVTLSTTHWPNTNRIMLRNRRVGLSMSGIQQFVAGRGLDTLKHWCNDGYFALKEYDRTYSDWFAIPRSVRLTTVKPSGSVSLLSSATPGMHWPESLTYIRRVRLARDSNLIPALVEAGYTLEPCVGQEESTVVIEIPVKIDDHGGKLRSVHDVSMWEQLSMASFLQKYWSDNAVSTTVSFDPETEGHQIPAALEHFQYCLKGVSFLPRVDTGAYPQMPYEAITEERYQEMASKLKPLDFGEILNERAEAEKYCDGDKCQI